MPYRNQQRGGRSLWSNETLHLTPWWLRPSKANTSHTRETTKWDSFNSFNCKVSSLFLWSSCVLFSFCWPSRRLKLGPNSPTVTQYHSYVVTSCQLQPFCVVCTPGGSHISKPLTRFPCLLFSKFPKPLTTEIVPSTLVFQPTFFLEEPIMATQTVCPFLPFWSPMDTSRPITTLPPEPLWLTLFLLVHLRVWHHFLQNAVLTRIVPIYYATTQSIKGTPPLNTFSINKFRRNRRYHQDLKRRKKQLPVVNGLKKRSLQHKRLNATTQVVAKSIFGQAEKLRVVKLVASSWQTKKKIMSSTSSVILHSSFKDQFVFTFIPILATACLFSLDNSLLVSWSIFAAVLVVQIIQFYANVHVFCLLLVSSVPGGQFFQDDCPADGIFITRKGVTFIYYYQVVTSEIESKVSLFSRFPQPPAVDLTTVVSIIDLVSNVPKHLSSLQFVRIVPSKGPCPIATFTSMGPADGLRESVEYHA